VQVIVATDVAARGIHVDDVACVVHFDVPTDAKDYVHRSGRTGRAGASGVVVTFVTEDDAAKVHKIQTTLGIGSPRAARPVERKPKPRRPAAQAARPAQAPRNGKPRPPRGRRPARRR
jgi:superfamily II DNA/RNA helicase